MLDLSALHSVTDSHAVGHGVEVDAGCAAMATRAAGVRAVDLPTYLTTYRCCVEAGAPSVPDSAMKRCAASWYPSMTSQFMTSRSIVALLTETELSRFAHSASGPLAEGAAGAGASMGKRRIAVLYCPLDRAPFVRY